MKVAPNYKDIGKRMRNIPMLADLDVRFRVMDGFDGYEQVLSLPTPPIEAFAGAAGARRAPPGDPRPRRARLPDVLQRARQADRRARVPSAVRGDGRLRFADL